MRVSGLATLAVVALCACGGPSTGDGGPHVGSITLSAGNNQVAPAGEALGDSLAVIVRDNAGSPMPGIAVTWSVTAGGGSVSPAIRLSDAGGISRTRRILGPNAGTQTARATQGNVTPVNFTAVSQIQGAVNIANATTGPLTDTVLAVKAESLDVLVTDQLAAPVQGVAVHWTAMGGTVSGTNVASSATGHSKVRYTYGATAGAQSATATVTGLVGSPVTITLQATAGTATNIAIQDNSFAPSTLTVPLHTTVTWSWQGANIHNVTFATATGVPADIGNHTTGTVNRTFDTAGTFNYHCTNHVGMTGQVTVNP